MITVKETVIVEGEYDKKKISSVVNANILVTGGFCIFKDKDMQRLIKRIAHTEGILILTDSDRAGFLIRNFIKNCTAGERVCHAFIPEIKGKEKRKTAPGKEGLLGVEGMESDVIRQAIIRSGATVSDENETTDPNKTDITKLDLYRAGLYGKENSKHKREEFLKKNGLPVKISANMLVDVLNLLFKKEDLELF